MKKELKTYEYAIKTIQNTTKDEEVIRGLEKKMRERKSYKMKAIINDISPFICKLEQVLYSEKIYIDKRKQNGSHAGSQAHHQYVASDDVLHAGTGSVQYR